MPNEADTCRRYVVPKLQAAGWEDEPHRINEQVAFTDGRIVVIGRRGRRRPPTTAERLGSIVKSCRKIMRKDKGLNGDLDRLSMLTWIMFLKFIDDMEQIEELRSKMRKAKFEPSIKPPYRWRDWAAQNNGITGPELLSFVTQGKTIRPDGTEGLGLLKYLGSLRNGILDRAFKGEL